eukprot:CAMPEP_0169458306 /NCGR_PEP_ID=MMETSP1042-20121227/17368_1 /TAXON_ID=464988 /ORGANISM="Hemiselmis andersenii, Strain CCMP1180" /LENGTH=91 /DNA_ID=CAMNT_0009570691 /DNA_START=153 /DNA_END=428 /DNA_ORIENTATION=+
MGTPGGHTQGCSLKRTCTISVAHRTLTRDWSSFMAPARVQQLPIAWRSIASSASLNLLKEDALTLSVSLSPPLFASKRIVPMYWYPRIEYR